MVEKAQSPSGGKLPACLPAHLNRPRLRRDKASQFLDEVLGLQYARATLAKLASTGGGPPIEKVGRTPYYPTEPLYNWGLSKLERR
jgi:hypothetical protein